MPSGSATYHHGDLAGACVAAAMELLEEEGAGDLSLRAVARRAGVAPSAPYRHYADRDALLSAVAAVGYSDLARHLAQVNALPSTPEELTDVAIAFIDFAVGRPGLFRVMFSGPCDNENDQRVISAGLVSAYLTDIVQRCFPAAPADDLATAIWGLLHGLAFLHIDGKLDASTPEKIDATVGGAVRAALALATAPVRNQS